MGNTCLTLIWMVKYSTFLFNFVQYLRLLSKSTNGESSTQLFNLPFSLNSFDYNEISQSCVLLIYEEQWWLISIFFKFSIYNVHFDIYNCNKKIKEYAPTIFTYMYIFSIIKRTFVTCVTSHAQNKVACLRP